jgi:chaperonin cofactor prefoldin
MITTTCSLLEDILFDSCFTLTKMVGSFVNEMKNKTTTEEEKIRFESMYEHVKVMTSKILNKKQSFYHFQEQLNSLMSQQRIVAISTMNSLFPTINV